MSGWQSRRCVDTILGARQCDAREGEFFMRASPIAFAVVALSCIYSGAQAASVASGNHQGGLILSSQDFRSREFRSAVVRAATEHCAFYNRIPVITGAVPGNGNYISFACRFDRRYDPVKNRTWFW
jgi:hypothetical protein